MKKKDSSDEINKDSWDEKEIVWMKIKIVWMKTKIVWMKIKIVWINIFKYKGVEP